MFTIKHVQESGLEVIWSGEMPMFVSKEAKARSQMDLGGFQNADHVSFHDEHNRCHHIHGGIVYVMNDHGKTVARYDMLGEAITQIDASAAVAAA
jgi:hypothetical protein